jgi:hypothetical protein
LWWTLPTSAARPASGDPRRTCTSSNASPADPNTILYRATIDDPTTFSWKWTIEYPFVSTPGPVYEYACHEGNYAMTDILGGARKMEAEAPKK